MHAERKEERVDLAAIWIVFIMLPVGLFTLKGQVVRMIGMQGDGNTGTVVAKAPKDGPRKEAFKPIVAPQNDVSFLEKMRRDIKKDQALSAARMMGRTSWDYSAVTSTNLESVYRDIFQQKGIRNEAFVKMMALDQTERQYAHAVQASFLARKSKNYEDARRALNEALQNLPSGHHNGRVALLEELIKVEQEAGNPEEVDRLHAAFREARMEQMRTILAARVEEGVISADQANRLLQAFTTDGENEVDMLAGGRILSGQGEDPDKAPERIASMIQTLMNQKN